MTIWSSRMHRWSLIEFFFLCLLYGLRLGFEKLCRNSTPAHALIQFDSWHSILRIAGSSCQRSHLVGQRLSRGFCSALESAMRFVNSYQIQHFSVTTLMLPRFPYCVHCGSHDHKIYSRSHKMSWPVGSYSILPHLG